MARTKLPLATVRVPVKRSRAVAIKAKFDDVDDLLDTMKTTVYNAAGAINPNVEFAVFDSAIADMAMTLADGTINGQTVNVLFRTKTGSGTVKITPATYTGHTKLTMSVAGNRAQWIWDTNTWKLRGGNDGVIV